ncbi:MAG: type II toxin-antitoxin system HigB family toxin, partial [Pseudomonadota bacterium]
WYNMLSKSTWQTPQELKADIRTASMLKGGRVVFNIGGNKYRVIVAIRYSQQIAWVRFVGTHAQYDMVDAETI